MAEIEWDRTEPAFRLDPDAERNAVERAKAFRQARDAAATEAALARLREATAAESNLFEPVLACVEAHTMPRERFQVLEDRWGTFRSPGV